ncbi:taurine catabolism dioxygenase TauD, TfdA family protein [Aspergillus leporis]|uniref:Taurine catabolism dioxygenase TauD, TfdA family protein n=1 Tax=Aspergillus leporis TaxID=41062 RepID=A0A5N5WIB5_9EURO|nr:taurine catabolism dioxygenase TauD, TfdA family protein [Aspergillus leporis]
MKASGALDGLQYQEVAPLLGRDFSDLQLSSIVSDDATIRDLAITASERGVLFFHNQHIPMSDFKILVQKLGDLTGKPATSKLHKHEFASENNAHLGIPESMDPEVYTVSSVYNEKLFDNFLDSSDKKFASRSWHADESFEHVPADYTGFKMIKCPKTGGDTVWASAYAAYERMSEPWQRFAEGLTASHGDPTCADLLTKKSLKYRAEERGSPENVGTELKAVHPVVQTNPVTGWKSLYGLGYQIAFGGINGVTDYENQIMQAYFLRLIADNHDLQIRHKWKPYDVAIWDNRSVFHNITNDFIGERLALRAVSIGNKPYLDPNSTTRSAALRIRNSD